jgi:hypothetical protein
MCESTLGMSVIAGTLVDNFRFARETQQEFRDGDSVAWVTSFLLRLRDDKHPVEGHPTPTVAAESVTVWRIGAAKIEMYRPHMPYIG